MFTIKFRFIWPSGFREDLSMVDMFVNGLELNQQSLWRTFQGCFLPRFAKRYQRRRFFRNQPIRNKNCLWWPCLLTDRDEMSNLYRGHAIDVSYQVSVHLAKRFQRRKILKIGQSEIRIAYGGHVCYWIGIK